MPIGRVCDPARPIGSMVILGKLWIKQGKMRLKGKFRNNFSQKSERYLTGNQWLLCGK
jgi:hypothetical protein